MDIYFKSSDGVALHGWFFRTIPEAKATILVFHGNAENLSTHVNSVLWLVQEGFNVFIFDYRGYGGNPGGGKIRRVTMTASGDRGVRGHSVPHRDALGRCDGERRREQANLVSKAECALESDTPKADRVQRSFVGISEAA